MRKRPLLIYLLFAFIPAWLVTLWLWLSQTYLLPYGPLFLSICMFMPALAVAVTKLICKGGWGDLGLRPRLKQGWPWYILAAEGPLLFIALGAALYYLVFPNDFNAAALPGLKPQLPLMLAALIFSPLINLIPCAGEELGWRGFLLPRLVGRFGPGRGLALTGLVWGLWHAPMIALGHNYGLEYPGWPWLGIFAMVLFCFFVGNFLSYATLKTGSFWPAALAHGSLNGCASLGLVFMVNAATADPFVGPVATGLLGGAGLIIAGLVSFLLVIRMPPASALEQD